ncbi:MAG TPA: hypothetical protein VG498_17370 [Terriglobales bacterium]|nr:hypothetical protein [Terriglobales bacterium]
MAEATLLSLGVSTTEPVGIWSSMLADLQRYRVLTLYWWMNTAVFAPVPASFGYFAVMNCLRARVQSVAIY